MIVPYKKLREEIQHTVITEWVMGHADEKKKDRPDKITKMEWENIYCDEAAEEEVNKSYPPPRFTPLPGYKAMLRLDNDWITTHHRENIRYADTAPALIEYAKSRLALDQKTFEDIDRNALGAVLGSLPLRRRIRTSKMIYRWLPVGHNWQKCNLETDKCPCCGAPDETFEHLLRCENEQLETVRQAALEKIRTDATTIGIPARVLDAILAIIRAVFRGDDPPEPATARIQAAALAQRNIGHYHMAIGLFSSQWAATMDELEVKQPQKKMEQMVSLVWDHLCEQVWETRCSILHGNEKNAATLDEAKTTAEKLKWYLQHQNEVIDYRHRFLVDFTREDVDRWTLATRRAKLTLLTNASKFYTNWLEQQAEHQSTIHDWLDSYMRLRNGKLIRRNERPTRLIPYAGSTETPTSDSEEFEFDW